MPAGDDVGKVLRQRPPGPRVRRGRRMEPAGPSEGVPGLREHGGEVDNMHPGGAVLLRKRNYNK
eukprot:1010614-Prorocentrum_minimum.AAC.1